MTCACKEVARHPVPTVVSEVQGPLGFKINFQMIMRKFKDMRYILYVDHNIFNKKEKEAVLSQTAGVKQLRDDIESLLLIIDPRVVVFHDIRMLQGFQKVDLRIQPLQVIGGLQSIINPNLVPSYLNSVHLIKCLVAIISISIKDYQTTYNCIT